ncbi:F-box protein skip19 [Heracleum sosnowskyi]|uniref:F-box protein skip19 n=1 Tax=Heracleum sosnowskyi TaxID=360622 RepID=A0AAD8HZZ6_9APIA|nr:F-box protein skip19 [Heracleum sosnowskyi]
MQDLIPDYFFGFDYLNVPLYNCVPVYPADTLRLDRQRAQDFADYLCTKYKTSEVKNTKLSDLPDDIIANILHRLGAFEILVNARRVCKAWREICEDQAMWRVIYIENLGSELWWKIRELEEMCRQAIDRRQGQLVDIKIEHIASDELLKYLADNKSVFSF